MNRPPRPQPVPSAVVRKTALIPGLVALTLMVGACSSDDDATSVSANEAADVLAQQFDLPTDTARCLTQGFREDAQARRAVGSEATPEDFIALNDAIDRCVAPEQLASSVAGLMARNYSPEGPVSPSHADCLEQQILVLPRDEQVLLITGPLNQQIDLGSPANLEAGDVVRRLAQECGLLGTNTTG